MAKRHDEDEDPMAEEEEESGFMNKVGPWSFILGLGIAVVSAFVGNVFWLLGALGVVVGLLNITDKEMNSYLLSSLTFLVSANALSSTLTKLAERLPFVGEWLVFVDPLLANVALFVAPGAAVVALKALYSLSRD